MLSSPPATNDMKPGSNHSEGVTLAFFSRLSSKVRSSTGLAVLAAACKDCKLCTATKTLLAKSTDEPYTE